MSEGGTKKGLLIVLEGSHEEFLQVSLHGYSALTWHHEQKPQEPQQSVALLGSWGRQALKDMMFLGTDFETHANRQGYAEEPAAKDFMARKACIITLSKAQGTEAVMGQATINLYSRVWKS
jgi:hypothetical protein